MSQRVRSEGIYSLPSRVAFNRSHSRDLKAIKQNELKVNVRYASPAIVCDGQEQFTGH